MTSELREALARGRTLRARYYTDRSIFEAEQARVFATGWNYVGLAERLQRAGDFFTCRIGEVPVVVVRDEAGEAGEIRAFANVCGHRGSELVLDECGNRKTLQCHYHAWTWGLDGNLRGAPRCHEQPGFDKAAFPLQRLALGRFGPFLFVNTSRAPKPFAEILGALPEIIAKTGIDLDAAKLTERREYRIRANWKVVVENFLECYHCAVSHPGFRDLIDLEKYEVVPYDYFSVQRGPLKASAKAARTEFYGNHQVQEGIYNYLWPNFMVNVYPGPGNASTNLVVPIDENNTLAIYEFFFADAMPEGERAEMVAFIDQVQKEDIVICESVQRGLRSGFYEQGQLILSRENGIQHFQRLVSSALGE